MIIDLFRSLLLSAVRCIMPLLYIWPNVTAALTMDLLCQYTQLPCTCRWSGSSLGADRLWQRLGCRVSLYRRAATGAAVLAVSTLTRSHTTLRRTAQRRESISSCPNMALAVTEVRTADCSLPALVAVPPEIRSGP